MSIKNRTWYVYKITFSNKDFYIGYHWCKCNIQPENDILINYKSSSKIVKDRLLSNETVKSDILAIFNNKEDAYNFEQTTIYNNFNDPNILNKACYYGRKGFGLLNISSRKKLSKATKERWDNPQIRKTIIENQKKSWTLERREKHKKWLRDVRWTSEGKRKQSDSLSGRKFPNRGKGIKKHKNFGKKISMALKGVPKTQQHKDALAVSKAKTYTIKFVNGNSILITNLRKWCRDNQYCHTQVRRVQTNILKNGYRDIIEVLEIINCQ